MFSKRLITVLTGVLFFASASPVFAASILPQIAPALIQGFTSLLGQTKGLGGAGGGPHPTCVAWVEQMKKTKKQTPPPPCQTASPNGPVAGICQMDTLCKATSLPGGSSPDAGGQALQQILQQLMQKLMQKEPEKPGAGAGGGQLTGTPTGSGSQYPPCQINPASNTVTSVPCIDSTGALVTNVAWAGGSSSSGTGSGSSGTAGSIADLLTGSLNSGAGSGGSSSGSGNSASDLLQAITGQTQTGATSSAPNTQVSANAGTQLGPKNSAGDIVVNKEGVTAVAGTRDQNVEVAGFIGSDTTGLQQSQGATARLCESRPWASGFLSSIIAPSFFDGVCAWRGYNVGPGNVPVVTPVYLTPSPRPAKPVVPQQTGVITVQPASVDIWASPTAVPLGTRTSIFWKAEGGAVSCKVSGPSFTQSGLSGGSATVPISGSSTFTVVCLNATGVEAVRDSVTVTLSI